MPFAMAALIAVVTTFDPMTAASGVPPWERTKLMAASPGLSRDPVTIAAMVSRTWCLVFSPTAAGSGQSRAPAI